MNSRRMPLTATLLSTFLTLSLAAQLLPGGIGRLGQSGQIIEQPEKAKAELTRTLQEYRQNKDLHGEAVTLLMLGIAEMGSGNPESARASLTEARTKMETQNDTVGTWMSLLVLAQFEQAMANWPRAIEHMEESFAVIDKAKVSNAPFTLKSLSILSSGSGLPPGTMEMMESSAELMKPMILEYFLAPISHDLYGSLLTEVGQFEKAEAELNAAVAGAQYFQGMYDFSIYAHFGDLRYRQKRYDEARTYYQKALSGSQEMAMNPMGNPLLKLGIYDRLARLETLTGHADEAMRWNDKSLEIVRAAGMPLQICVALETRGMLLMRSERFAEAESAFQEAMKIAESTKNTARQASIESHMGNLQILNGKYRSAASHLERSVHLYQSLKDPISEAATWGSLANAYALTDNFDAAEDALERARKLTEKSQFSIGKDMIVLGETWLRFRKGQATTKDITASLDRFMGNAQIHNIEIAQDVEQVTRHTIKAIETGNFSVPLPVESTLPMIKVYSRLTEGMQQLEQGNIDEARRIWREALAKNPSKDMRVSLFAMVGATYWREGNPEQASQWFSDAIQALEEAGADLSEAMLIEFLGSYHRAYYDVLIESLLRSGQIGKAFETTERARSRAFLLLLGNTSLKAPDGNGSALAKEANALRKEIADWDRNPQPDKRLVDLRRRYDVLQTRLQAAAPEYASLTSVPSLELDEVRKELPANTTLVSYFVTVFGVQAWVLDQEKLEHVRLNVSAPQMRRITCWAYELARPRGGQAIDGNGCGDPASAEEAYAALIAPLRDKIRNDRLMIVPHGELHYVPFAALRDSKGKYLVEDYPITYVPSVSTLRFLRGKESPVKGGALVLGDPAARTQTRLDGARVEAEKVAAKLRTRAELAEHAQESLLYRRGKKVDLVHIAAHATYDATNPLFSAIHLAEGGEENGQLTVDEIQSELDLKGVNLVVLSACKSGVGNRSGGDEIIGLTRSILYAGSPGVISTLWNISDEATPPLIEKFYDHLLTGISPADALRAAQTALLQDQNYAHPKYWAAFQLTGDPQGRWKK